MANASHLAVGSGAGPLARPGERRAVSVEQREHVGGRGARGDGDARERVRVVKGMGARVLDRGSRMPRARREMCAHRAIDAAVRVRECVDRSAEVAGENRGAVVDVGAHGGSSEHVEVMVTRAVRADGDPGDRREGRQRDGIDVARAPDEIGGDVDRARDAGSRELGRGIDLAEVTVVEGDGERPRGERGAITQVVGDFADAEHRSAARRERPHLVGEG
jgi:hypothetical protein